MAEAECGISSIDEAIEKAKSTLDKVGHLKQILQERDVDGFASTNDPETPNAVIRERNFPNVKNDNNIYLAKFEALKQKVKEKYEKRTKKRKEELERFNRIYFLDVITTNETLEIERLMVERQRYYELSLTASDEEKKAFYLLKERDAANRYCELVSGIVDTFVNDLEGRESSVNAFMNEVSRTGSESGGEKFSDSVQDKSKSSVLDDTVNDLAFFIESWRERRLSLGAKETTSCI